MELVPPLRDPRRLQPLRRRLARRPPRIGPPRRRAHRRRRLQPRRRPRPARPARRPRQLDDLEDRHPAPRRSRRAASHSRPHQSNDNPFSESNFKTLKYFPTFPKRFASIDHARGFTDAFFDHYNHHHRHSGIGLHTPADVHYGRADAVRAQRQAVLDAAYHAHPERIPPPTQRPRIPEAAWINPPQETPLAAAAL